MICHKLMRRQGPRAVRPAASRSHLWQRWTCSRPSACKFSLTMRQSCVCPSILSPLCGCCRPGCSSWAPASITESGCVRLCLWRRLCTGLQGVLYLAGRFRRLERLLCVRFPGDPPEDGDWGRFQADPGTERFGCDQSDGGAVVDDSGVCPDISKYSRTTSRKWAGIRIPSGPSSEKPRLPK